MAVVYQGVAGGSHRSERSLCSRLLASVFGTQQLWWGEMEAILRRRQRRLFFSSICYRILMEFFAACCPIALKAVACSTEKGILASDV